VPVVGEELGVSAVAQQLVALGAVEHLDNRYYVGARAGRIGACWQPNPLLRQAAQASVHTLAVQSRAMASLRILDNDRLRVVCASVSDRHAYIPGSPDPRSTARTATGRVLYAANTDSDLPFPDAWTAREWRQLRASIRDLHATVVDQQEVFPGICCVSAPVWWPDRTCAGAVTALLPAAKPTPTLRHLVVHAARSVGAGLRRACATGITSSPSPSL
jgi:IclR family transcriptional regulator, acetate operon repressor